MNKSNTEQHSEKATTGLLSFLFSFQQVCEKFKEMMPNNIRSMRMAKEMIDLTRNPPHGITCWSKNDRNDQLEAIIQGSKDTPYENGSFRIDIVIPDRYPMDPPQLKFLTKVYHPNIDNSTGLICLDVLKMPPHGRWRPVNNLSLILTAVQQLLSDPNPHDPLDAAVAQEYIANRSLFLENAKKWTQLYAVERSSSRSSKRKSMDEEETEATSKRVCTSPSSPRQQCDKSTESIDEVKPTLEDSVETSEESPNKIVSKRKRNNNEPVKDEPVQGKIVKKSSISPILLDDD